MEGDRHGVQAKGHDQKQTSNVQKRGDTRFNIGQQHSEGNYHHSRKNNGAHYPNVNYNQRHRGHQKYYPIQLIMKKFAPKTTTTLAPTKRGKTTTATTTVKGKTTKYRPITF